MKCVCGRQAGGAPPVKGPRRRLSQTGEALNDVRHSASKEAGFERCSGSIVMTPECVIEYH